MKHVPIIDPSWPEVFRDPKWWAQTRAYIRMELPRVSLPQNQGET